MKSAPHICMVTPGHLASTPRLVKAADALHAAGYSVTVLASDHYPMVRPLDASILASAPWRTQRLPACGTVSRFWSRVLRRLALRQCRDHSAPKPQTAALANFNPHTRFVHAAARIKADLYIGHTLAGLVIAGTAAARVGARLGFDAEDWHSEEIADDALAPGEKNARRILEKYWVPRCDMVTAASPLIAEAYAPLRDGHVPPVVLNVFPLREAPVAALQAVHPSLYWFSQTIGPGRGLEEIVAALAELPPEWSLHLRGQPSSGYESCLRAVARRLGVDARIHWLASAPPPEMVRLAAEHGVGLALELTTPLNRACCLTNKIFTYLLAGVPVLLSDTPAQRRLATDLGVASSIASLNNPGLLAASILTLAKPEARQHAWRLGQTRYNWEREAPVLVAAVNALFRKPSD